MRVEHVGGRADRRAVQGKLGDGVEPFAGEVEPLVGELVGREVERGAVFPVALADPEEVELAGADARVGDQSGAHEVGVDAAGDAGWDVACFANGCGDRGEVAEGAHGPFFVGDVAGEHGGFGGRLAGMGAAGLACAVGRGVRTPSGLASLGHLPRQGGGGG